MDSNCKEIIDYISRKEDLFKDYLHKIIQEYDVLRFLDKVSEITDVYIFSGIIRNFFLNDNCEDIRDLDLVIRDLDKVLLPKSIVRNKNSYGGYKLNIKGLTIDVWKLSDTWGLKREKWPLTSERLINTSFFNFSAIVYDYNKEEFIYDGTFCSFLRHKELDIVYPKNPNIPLCIVNTLYYSDKYKFEISTPLRDWIKNNYNFEYDYELTQLKHWKEIKFNNQIIEDFINKLNNY